jgi:hypothetical protein
MFSALVSELGSLRVSALSTCATLFSTKCNNNQKLYYVWATTWVEENNEKTFNCVDDGGEMSFPSARGAMFGFSRVRLLFVRHAGLSGRKERGGRAEASSRYKTKIKIYFSNQLIFKCRCMRNALLSRSYILFLLHESTQMREKEIKNINTQARRVCAHIYCTCIQIRNPFSLVE